MARTQRPPAYRRRVVRGKEVAYLRLTDRETGKLKDVWLGPYGSPESRELYARATADWESRGRRLPSEAKVICDPSGPTLTQLFHRFFTEACPNMSEGEQGNFDAVIRLARSLFGSQPAIAFGPNSLRAVRDAMIKGDPHSKSPRRPWTRRSINKQVGRIRQMFKWAVAHEMIPASAWESLRAIEPLRLGHAGVKESPKVECAPCEAIERVKRNVSPQVAAMIELQLLSGMRPGEVCALRPCDINMSGAVWLYQPSEHKMKYRERERMVYLGPKAQHVVKRFLEGRRTDEYLFSPTEATEWQRAKRSKARKTPLSCGNRVGTNRQPTPLKQPGVQYTKDSYRRAIADACTKAGVPHWHPHQLRHNYATDVRKKYGLEAAQILLGHSSALVTEAVYAERDMGKARQIAEVIG